MRRSIFLFAILVVLLVIPKNTNSANRDELLSEEDVALEALERNGTPALSAPLDASEYWESFNQWMCFDRDSIELTQVEVESGAKVLILPMITASLPGAIVEISILGEDDRKNETIFALWKTLIEGSKKICAYAAYLNNLETENGKPASTWIANRIKTENGYWE